ncbi:Disease resistance protein RPS2 [Spatholobus suberectus]|nr:Disease resistance protein RPS2 [Spatholobus suberectus]
MESSRLEFLEGLIQRQRSIAEYETPEAAFGYNRRLMEQIKMLKQIGFAKQNEDNILVASELLQEVKEAPPVIELPETDKVHLEDLPNLKSLSSTDMVEWQSLENVVVKHCPNLKEFGLGKIEKPILKSVIVENQVQLDIDTKIAYLFELSDEFSTITEYNVGDDEELGKAIDNLRPSHFTNLLLFWAKNCNQFLKLDEFLSVLVRRSKRLEAISIEHCNTSIVLFDTADLFRDKDGDGKYFTQIRELKLRELFQLSSIWHEDPTGIFGLENLQIIHIKSCPHLRYLIFAPIAEKLHQLKELKLEACGMADHVVIKQNDNLKIIKFPALSKVEFKSLSILWRFYKWHLEFPSLKTLTIETCPELEEFTTGFATADASSTTDGRSFSELNELKLDSCPELVVVVSSETLQELRNLKKIIVSHCDALEMVFNIHGETSHSTELLQQLDELILIDLPNLTHIINREITRLYQNLQILQVKQCESLNWLPMSLMITNMEISDCKDLEKIMIISEEEGMRGKATFSQLKDVSLENLANLSTVFPSSSEFPSLETLKIAKCPALMTFVEESNGVKDHPESAISNYFFPNSLSLDKLKVLYVINQDVEKLWHYSCPSESFCELENLTLSNNNKLLSVISSSMIIRFNKLKKLTLDNCELLIEVFNLEDDKPDHNIQEMFPQLGALALSNLSNLTSVWNKEPQVPFSQICCHLSLSTVVASKVYSHLLLPTILGNSNHSNCVIVRK